MTQQATVTPLIEEYPTLDQAKGYICAVEHNHPGYDDHLLNETELCQLARHHGYLPGSEQEEWIQGHKQGFLDANIPYELVATLEELQQTAKLFGRRVVEVPEDHIIIVLDSTFVESDTIRQFRNSPEGCMRARRWAVNLDPEDEASSNSYAELIAANLADYYRLDRNQ